MVKKVTTSRLATAFRSLGAAHWTSNEDDDIVNGARRLKQIKNFMVTYDKSLKRLERLQQQVDTESAFMVETYDVAITDIDVEEVKAAAIQTQITISAKTEILKVANEESSINEKFHDVTLKIDGAQSAKDEIRKAALTFGSVQKRYDAAIKKDPRSDRAHKTKGELDSAKYNLEKHRENFKEQIQVLYSNLDEFFNHAKTNTQDWYTKLSRQVEVGRKALGSVGNFTDPLNKAQVAASELIDIGKSAVSEVKNNIEQNNFNSQSPNLPNLPPVSQISDSAVNIEKKEKLFISHRNLL